MSRIKHNTPATHKPGTKDILYSLKSEYQWLARHIKKGDTYHNGKSVKIKITIGLKTV
ncbi:hypothetical protein [Mucilaginibacter sp.]